ncbi:beta-ketoacyl synthase N-terminal-like domain-containing protein [Sorangium sp. So ce375]|uniref:beta-ketoacyl synthase N-terminal-like domain-containing protein n=1 Tax=Sorangium sp. So ce375 TaxID=3133306 RepID=UPI003F5BD408
MISLNEALGVDISERLFAFGERYPSVIEQLVKRLTESSPGVDPAKPSLGAQLRELDELLYELLVHQLLSIDLIEQPGRLDPRHQLWFRETWRRLRDRGVLVAQGGRFTVPALRAASGAAAWQRWDQRKPAWLADPDLKSKVVLAEAMLRALPDILTGQRLATDVMFPNASMELVEGVYRDTFPARLFNEVLADAVGIFIQQRMQQSASAEVRILEIGAGTGGTSAIVLHELRPYRQHVAEYCYTDVSRAFLLHAETKFGRDNPFLRCQLFNVELPAAGQGVAQGQYDLVIATNVLHATKNIRNTLRNAKALLKKNGLLLVNEISDGALWLHLTFGLLEGWWLSQDPELRLQGSPGLPPSMWREALEMEGYRSVRFPLERLHEYGHQLIIAESDGIARQPAPSAAGARPRPAPPPPPGPPAPSAALSEEQLLDQVRGIVRQGVSEALKLDERSIRDDRSFADYGVDSIIGVRMMNALNKRYGVQMQTTSLFDHGSVDKLSRFIVRELKHQPAQASAQVQAPAPAQAPERPARVARSAPGEVVPEGSLLDTVKAVVRESVAGALKMDPGGIRNDRSFADYGVDSIVGVRLVNTLNKRCGIQMLTTSLFDHGSVDKLSQHIVRAHRPSLASPGPEAPPSAVPAPEAPPKAPVAPLHSPVAPPQAPVARPRWVESQAASPPPAPAPPVQAYAASERDIAIIGMSGRFARSQDLRELWSHLSAGADLVTPITRWDLAERYQGTPLAEKKSICNAGGFLDDIDKFDPLFFNISGLEATYMDPQQRVFLEESWKALEDAGYAGDSVQGLRFGVYVGTAGSDYKRLIDEKSKLPAQVFWGNSSSILAARISYYLDLQGPAIAVDTACSSSLVAIHLACQGLWSGETEVALAGGVFIQCTPEFYESTERAGMLSPTGRCHTFDERADGFVPGEGVGVLVLKRLADAVAAGDHIHGVIRASAMNQDGQSNGITAPSAKSQERLVRSLYDSFQIDPESIQMVEAHGTGTKLGDPIELNALTDAFRYYTRREGFCAIGSIKTNIGHTATAAGVAGILKILLSMKHEQMPPSLHYRNTNPNIQLQGSPFYVSDRLRPWTVAPDQKRRAVVSSFGFSGTNVHMLIEEAPTAERRRARQPAHLIALSALSHAQLRQQAERLAARCEGEPGLDCVDVSYTLMAGRKHLNHRLACVVGSTGELGQALREWLATGRARQVFHAQVPENGAREEAERRRHGNQCIAECAGAAEAARRERLSAVAELYVQGYSLEYGKLFEGEAYGRIPLPTYPFARERYWVPEASAHSKTLQNGTAQNGVLHNGTSHNGVLHNGTVQNGALHNGTVQNGALHNGTVQNGTPQNGVLHNGTVQNGTPQNGALQNGTVQNGALHNGTVQNGTPQNGVLQNGRAHSSLEQLLDGVLDQSVSIDVAAAEARKALHWGEL